jgi:hypothetical protein
MQHVETRNSTTRPRADFRPKPRLLIIATLSAVSLFLGGGLSEAQTAAIRFNVAVPPAPAQMQIYKLRPTSAPVGFLNEKLDALKLPHLHLEHKIYIARGTTGRDERDRERAFADPVSGDTVFTPNLAELVSPRAETKPLPLGNAQSVARAVLTDRRFIPQDVTELRMADPITIMGGATTRAPAKASPPAAPQRIEPRAVLTIVPAVRYANGFRVYGLGSHAAVSLDNEGTMVGALRRWRSATTGGLIHPRITAAQVRAAITRQLRPQLTRRDSRATVDQIAVAYYDGNTKYLQPIYYFTATIHPPERRIADIRVRGYVPIGTPLEPIPDLAARSSGPEPGTPKRTAAAAPPTALAARTVAANPADISLGEYVNQDWPNNGAYVDMSNQFLAGLTFLSSLFPGATPPVARTQWYVAYPWEVVGPASQSFLNAVNVAYTVPHGDWLTNSTLSNCCDLWSVSNIGTGGNPGFGAAAGGVLATWIIMSCEVIPSWYDRQNEAGGSDDGYTAFDAWFPVFQGLHNVIGFRTEMFYPDDNLQFGFGYDASVGGDVNAAWFQEVAANDGNDGTYNDGHLIGNPLVGYDRASTMIDARDLGQSIYSIGAQSPSSTIWNFWMNN